MMFWSLRSLATGLRPGFPARSTAAAAGLLALAVLAGGTAPALAQSYRAPGPPGAGADPIDEQLKKVRLQQKLNNFVPPDISFRDENGRTVTMGNYLGKKPVALVLIQFRCTMLCTQQLSVMLQSMRELKFTPGKEFELVIVSIDPREGTELAAEQKKNYLEEYGRPEAEAGWHWLTGSKANIDRLAEAVGYHYVYDPRTDQYAHPDGIILLTPDGKVARYFFRLEYPPQGLRLGLVEASQGKIGNPVDLIALLCYHYNPVTGKYALAVMKIVRLMAIATVLGMAVGVVIMKRRDHLSRRQA